MQMGQWGQKEHGAYEVSPFYKAGAYSLTAGMGHLDVTTGRMVPVTGPPAPDYWSAGLESLDRHDFKSQVFDDGGDVARKFTRLHKKILRRRSVGKDIPRPLRQEYKKFKAITPGAEMPQLPVKLIPHPLIRAKGSAGFLQWFRSAHPVLFARMERERPELLVTDRAAAMQGLGNAGGTTGMATDPVTTTTVPTSGWSSAMFGFLDKVLVNNQQKNMAEINLELATQGYAPVGFVEQAQAKVEQITEAYVAQPPAVKFGIPLALAAAGVGLWFFMR